MTEMSGVTDSGKVDAQDPDDLPEYDTDALENAADTSPPEPAGNGIGEDGTYRWEGADGSRLAFGADGSFSFEEAAGDDSAVEAPAEEAGDGGAIEFDGDVRALDATALAATVEQIRDEESEAGAGVKFDGDGDGILDDRVYANEFGGLTTVESEGTMKTVDANGSHGFRDEAGNVFQGNADGTFIHLRADGTAVWRTAEESGETVRDESGALVSTRTGADGDVEAVDTHPSGLLTLPGLRQDGLMAILDEQMEDGFFSEEVQTMLGALAQTDLG